MTRLPKILLLPLWLIAAPALAQSNVVESGQTQEPGQSGGQGSTQDRGQEVQVGAGTTTETTTGTTGSSGPPQSSASGQAGAAQQQKGPPDLASLCDDVQEQVVRQNCIEKAAQ